MLNILPSYELEDQVWFLSRAIKALAFTDRLKKALNFHSFKRKIIDYYIQKGGKVDVVGDLIIQFICKLIYDESYENLPLKRLNGTHINETNARISIESATAFLYSQEPIKKVIESNLFSFADKTGNGWIKGLITNK
jgi:hypothetical protein